MLSLALPGRVFVCTLPTDMRKSFDSLAVLVQTHLDQDALSGDLFVFRSRRGDRIKLLWWDEDGYGLFYKRLEVGSFVLPVADGKRATARIPRAPPQTPTAELRFRATINRRGQSTLETTASAQGAVHSLISS